MSDSGEGGAPQKDPPFRIEIPRDKVNAVLSPEIIGPLVLLVALIVFSFLPWVSTGGASASGWSLGIWFAGGFSFWLSLALILVTVSHVLSGKSGLLFLRTPMIIVQFFAVFGIFIFSVTTSTISPGYGLIVSLVASVVLVFIQVRSLAPVKRLRAFDTDAPTDAGIFVLLSCGIGATFLPWSFGWGAGFHAMIPGWELGWGVGKYYFVVALASFVMFAYSRLQNHTFSKQVSGLLCLLACFFVLLGLLKACLGSPGFSSAPNFGILFGLFIQVWCARILLGRNLSSIVKFVSTPT